MRRIWKNKKHKSEISIDSSSSLVAINFAILSNRTIVWDTFGSLHLNNELLKSYNIPQEEIYDLVRGSIMHTMGSRKMVFYKLNPDGFEKVNEDLIPYVKLVGGTACQYLGHGTYEIWNGINDVKAEMFPNPQELCYDITLEYSFGRRHENLRISKLWEYSKPQII